MKLILINILLFFLLCNSKEYKAVDELDLTMYVGKWYETYGDNFNKLFQGNGRCSTANYSLLDNGKVSVLNKQININNELETITGYAYYKDDDYGGYLTVSLQNNPDAPYWVLELGPVVDNYYDYSIVSDDRALSLYVLARDVDRFYDLYNDTVLESLGDFGFKKLYNHPVTMNQTECYDVKYN